MRAVVVAVVVCSSFAAADPATRIPAPATLVARPLEVGQWAAYREVTSAGEVGIVTLLAVNRAACGMQFSAVLHGSATKQWIFCVDDDHNLVKATLDGKEVVLHDHADELRALVTRVLLPGFVGEFTRDDVSVPAGTFEGCERKDGPTTTWLHPAVPLGAVVQVKAGDRKDVLIAYGTATTSMGMPGRGRPVRRPPPTFIDGALGVAGLSGVGPGRASTVDWSSATVGFWLGPHVDGVLVGGGGDTGRAETDATLATKTLEIGAGARYWPFREHIGRHGLIDSQSLFFQLTAGYSRIGKMDAVGNGLGVTPLVGWQLQTMRDWAVTLSIFDEAAVYAGKDFGFRNAFGVTAAIELWIQ